MKDKVQIVNWLLTRRCNLSCSYCAIVRNYKGMPEEYPPMKHYLTSEMKTRFVIDALEKIKKHNPNCFHIFYGGEPMLRKDLPEIIRFCNENEVLYTIITNNTPEVQPMIEHLFLVAGEISGITSSVDPLPVVREGEDSDFKSSEGFKRLIEQKEIVDDVVAEITVTKQNLPHLYKTVKTLTENGISSSITFIDPKKSPYYDFSNTADDDLLVGNSMSLHAELNHIKNDGLDVHMRDDLFDFFLSGDVLPSNYDCKLEDGVHNLTIDADGTVRLCLRIRGVMAPKLKITDCFMYDGRLLPSVRDFMAVDKKNYCRLCNWTCPMMTEITSKKTFKINDLIHKDRRE